MSPAARGAIAVLLLAAAGGAFMWWRRQAVPTPPAAPIANAVPPTVAPTAPPPAPTRPAILHPIGSAASPTRGGLPDLDDSDAYLRSALGDLLGRKAVLSFLSVDAFARRVVATVNNLATDHAAAGMWPVNRTPGPFGTETGAGGSVIGARNADRYAAFVRIAEGIDVDRAVALYTRVYPLLQTAYEDLGFPGQYFNDRVVEVIDHLLATPDPAEPTKVKLVEVAGATRPPGTAALYVFEDPALEASSSGRKILLRVGRDNARRLRAKLVDVRQRIARGSGARIPKDQ